jgi:methionyl aminopeptidase
MTADNYDKSTPKIEKMHAGGTFASKLRKQLVEYIKPGISTLELEEHAQYFYKQNNLQPSFQGYQGYPHSIVVCVNDEVVHGMPSKRTLTAGDIVTIDLGVLYQGYHTDTAITVEVATARQQRFLGAGQEALGLAIKQCRVGNYVGDISYAIQSCIERYGYNVVRAFVGHGIGRDLHEDLQIPCYGDPKTGPELRPGMTVAVEVMYMEGSFALDIKDDGWTVVTRDGKLSAMFEHTVAITQSEPLILTQ